MDAILYSVLLTAAVRYGGGDRDVRPADIRRELDRRGLGRAASAEATLRDAARKRGWVRSWRASRSAARSEVIQAGTSIAGVFAYQLDTPSAMVWSRKLGSKLRATMRGGLVEIGGGRQRYDYGEIRCVQPSAPTRPARPAPTPARPAQDAAGGQGAPSAPVASGTPRATA